MSTISSPDLPQLQDYVHPMESEDDSDSECLVIEMSSRISLHCPYSQNRIKIPVKGYLCKHPQCFDYGNFGEMNSRRPTWKCPVCCKPVCNLDIRIDQDFAKMLNEVAEDISDVIISADGCWTTENPTITTELNRNTITQNNHLNDIIENLTYKEPNDTFPNSCFTLCNSSGSPIGMRQSTVTRDVASPARIQLQGSYNIIRTPPVNQTTHHMNPINLTTTQPSYNPTNPHHPSSKTHRTTQTTNPFTPVQPTPSVAPNSPRSIALDQWRRHVFGQSQPPPTIRPPLPTSIPGDPMPPGRMRGSLQGNEHVAAQWQSRAPPQQPARANEPWSRPISTPIVEVSNATTTNGLNLR